VSEQPSDCRGTSVPLVQHNPNTSETLVPPAPCFTGRDSWYINRMPLLIGLPQVDGEARSEVSPPAAMPPHRPPLTAVLPSVAVIVALAFLFVGVYNPQEAYHSPFGPYEPFVPGLCISLFIGGLAFYDSLRQPRTWSGAFFALCAVALTAYQLAIPYFSPEKIFLR
jgi:hypothetical protein